VVDKVRVGLLGKTPGFFEPRLEFVFFSVFLTVSGLICSTYSKRTIWSAKSSSVMPLTPIWSLATRQMNELGFSFAVQAPPFGTFSREASGKSHSQVLLNKSLRGSRITVRRLMESVSAICSSVELGSPWRMTHS